MRLCTLVGLLVAAPVLAQSAELHPDEWTQGRALLTVGGGVRGLVEQTRQTGPTQPDVVLGAGPVFVNAAFSGAWFFRSALGVAADVRLDPFRYEREGVPADRVRYYAMSGSALGLARWQPSPLVGLEGQLGWAGAARPLILANGAQARVGEVATTGPVGGLSLNLDFGRSFWLQLYARVELVASLNAVEVYGRLLGSGVTGGLQSRVASFRLGPIELGVGVLAEFSRLQLQGELPLEGQQRTGVQGTLLRLGLGATATLRRPPPSTVTTGPMAVARGVRGRVVKADRSPVTGALVTIGTTALVSGPDGAFEVTDLARGSYAVKASAAGLRPASVQVVVADGMTETELVLETPTGPGRVTGVVSAAPDKPLAGAKVVSGNQTTTTNTTGAYTLEAVGPGPVKVRVMLDGYVPADEAVQVPPESTATLDVTLEPATQRAKAKLRGVISSAAGPVAKATVRVVELKLKQAVKPDGRFELDVPGGKYTLVIEAPKHVTQTKQVEVADGDQAIFQIELEKLR